MTTRVPPLPTRIVATILGWFAILVCLFTLSQIATGQELKLASDSATTIDFEGDIAPILVEHCIRCHSSGINKGDLSLETINDSIDADYIVAGEPDSSHLIDVISSVDGEPPLMPLEGTPLSEKQVRQIRDWISGGAKWPDEIKIREKPKADATWWSLQKLVAGETSNQSIDIFVDQALRARGLQANPPADRRTLIRRATFDLIGLPPTPEQVADFVDDRDPAAYEKLIDRLLNSPRYGEHWGRHWLDVIRFGESTGFERNVIIDDLWPLRDYVIQSINDDKPMDQLIREHLAGDAIPDGLPDSTLATAFLVAGAYDNVGNQDAVQAAQIRANTIDEMISATSEAFLGMTVACARCHDHKFDPITQDDYYSLYATFAGVHHGSAPVETVAAKESQATTLKPLNEKKHELQARLDELGEAVPAETQVTEESSKSDGGATDEPTLREKLVAELEQLNLLIDRASQFPQVFIGTRNNQDVQRPFHLFIGGSPQRLGSEVQPTSLRCLSGVTAEYELPSQTDEATRRAKLAEWITHDDNPLTPRVLANRIWHYHFGAGIVDTPNDFGFMGGAPSHPELLDFLAQKLKENHWQLKPMHRLVMLSDAYRRSSEHRDAGAIVDADARLLWRFPPRRLTAEQIRDAMLQISGKLNPAIDSSDLGGAGFRLYEVVSDNVSTYLPLDRHDETTYRRAVYHQNARASVVDLMTEFDQPDCAFTAPRRSQTITPLQALTMMNHSFTIDMSRSLAERLDRECGEDKSAKIQRLFQLCYSRSPSTDEEFACSRMVDEYGWISLCRTVFNTTELIYLR